MEFMSLPIVDSLVSVVNFYSSAIVSVIAMIVSIIALIYAAKTYWLKSGIKIRGGYTTARSISCQDTYIRNIILENLKDKSVVIFNIHLKLGRNYFIEIDDFTNNP